MHVVNYAGNWQCFSIFLQFQKLSITVWRACQSSMPFSDNEITLQLYEVVIIVRGERER